VQASRLSRGLLKRTKYDLVFLNKKCHAEFISAPHMQSMRHASEYAGCTPSKPLVPWGAETSFSMTWCF
jgi:hypothetical protein